MRMTNRNLTVTQDGCSNCQDFLPSFCSAWCLFKGREWSLLCLRMDGERLHLLDSSEQLVRELYIILRRVLTLFAKWASAFRFSVFSCVQHKLHYHTRICSFHPPLQLGGGSTYREQIRGMLLALSSRIDLGTLEGCAFWHGQVRGQFALSAQCRQLPCSIGISVTAGNKQVLS